MIFALLPTISMSMIVKNDGILNNNECTIIHFESTTFTCSNNIKTIIYTDQLLEIGDRVLVEGKPEKFKNDNFSSTS